MVVLSNVDNTSDVSKPSSTATQTALNLKSNLANLTFTGTLAAPTVNATIALQVAGANINTLYVQIPWVAVQVSAAGAVVSTQGRYAASVSHVAGSGRYDLSWTGNPNPEGGSYIPMLTMRIGSAGGHGNVAAIGSTSTQVYTFNNSGAAAEQKFYLYTYP